MQVGQVDDIQPLPARQTDVSVARTDAQTAHRLVDLDRHTLIERIRRLLHRTRSHIPSHRRIAIQTGSKRPMAARRDASQEGRAHAAWKALTRTMARGSSRRRGRHRVGRRYRWTLSMMRRAGTAGMLPRRSRRGMLRCTRRQRGKVRQGRYGVIAGRRKDWRQGGPGWRGQGRGGEGYSSGVCHVHIARYRLQTTRI